MTTYCLEGKKKPYSPERPNDSPAVNQGAQLLFKGLSPTFACSNLLTEAKHDGVCQSMQVARSSVDFPNPVWN